MSGPQGPDPTSPWQGQDQPAGGASEPQQPATDTPAWQPPSGEQPAPAAPAWAPPSGEQPAPAGWQPPAYTAPQYPPYQPPSAPGYAPPPQYPQPASTPGYAQPQYGDPSQFGQQPPQYGQPQYGQQPGQYGQPDQYGQPQYGQPGQYPQQPGQYGQPDQFGQPQYGQPGAVDGSKRSMALIGTILGVLAAVIIGVVLILGFWKPGFFVTTKLDVGKAQSGVQQILSDEANGYGAKNVKDVKCNNGQSPTVKKGDTFNCEVSIDGTKRQVTVTFQDDSGTYEVGRPK
jgi:Domain of unknown function (DUF4333)